MSHTIERRAAYSQGYRAAMEWVESRCREQGPENPFSRGDKDHTDWKRGFDDGIDDWRYAETG